MNKRQLVRLKGIAMHLWLAKQEADLLKVDLADSPDTKHLLDRTGWTCQTAYQKIRDRLSIWGDVSLPDESPKSSNDYQAPAYTPPDLGEPTEPPPGFFDVWRPK
jgi:hypothetical protein